MIKVLLLIIEPVATWDREAKAPRGVYSVLFLFLIPLLAISSAGEAWGILQWGKERGALTRAITVSADRAVVYGAFQFGLGLLTVLLGAKMIKTIAESFHGRPTFSQCFTTVAYGLGPLFLIRMANVWPPMNNWVAWAIGMTVSASVVYHGLPRMLRPDPPHALGLYFVAVLLLTAVSGVATLFAYLLMQGKLTF